MKKKYIAAILAAVLLSSCGNEKAKTEETDIIETNAFAEESEDAAETALTTEDTSVRMPVIIDEREAVPKASNEFKPAINLENFAEDGYYIDMIKASAGDILLAVYADASEETESQYLVGISIKDKTELFRIDAPFADCYFELYQKYTDGKRTACAVIKNTRDESVSLIEADSSGNYTITEGMTSEDIVSSWSDKAVKTVNGSIVSASDGTVLCSRTDEENDPYSVNSKLYSFSVPLDDDRFVFSRIGYEWADGVGVYDFETNTSQIIADSTNTAPLGIHGGMIYTVDSFDGVGTNIYITDPDDLVKKELCGSPFELRQNDMLYYAMHESGSFIAAEYEPSYDSSAEKRVVILSPDTGNIAAEYSLPDDISTYNSFYPLFITENYICLVDDDDVLYCADIPKGEFVLENKGDTTELTYTFLDSTVTIQSYDNSVTWNPKEYSISDFNDIMGFDGVKYSYLSAAGIFYGNNYYSEIGGQPVCIATSFGDVQADDYTADIDGDGEEELVCNCVYGGDGALECYIYKRFGDDVRSAAGTSLIPEEIIREQIKANDISAEYVPEKNVILCGYVQDEEYVKQEYGAEDISGLVYQPFMYSAAAEE